MTQHIAETRGGLLKFRESIGLKTASLLMAGIAIASCTNSDSNSEAQQSYNAEYAVDDSATLDGNECPPPNAQAYAYVEKAFSDEATDLTTANKTIYEIADELGLQLLPFSNKILQIRLNMYEQIKTPHSQVHSALNDYAKNFGVRVSVAAKDIPLLPAEDRPLTTKDLEKTKTHESMLALADALSLLPVEFVQEVGLKKVVFMQINSSTKSAKTISARVLPDIPDTIYVDPRKPISAETIFHEIFHLIDVQMCGTEDFGIDENFNDLNPGNVYKRYRSDESKKGTAKGFTTREFVEDTIGYLESEAYNAQLAGNYNLEAAIQYKIQQKKSRVIADESYGLSEIAEDKATIAENLLILHGQRQLLDPDSPILREKALLLLSRLYEEYPKFTALLAAAYKTGYDKY